MNRGCRMGNTKTTWISARERGSCWFSNDFDDSSACLIIFGIGLLFIHAHELGETCLLSRWRVSSKALRSIVSSWFLPQGIMFDLESSFSPRAGRLVTTSNRRPEAYGRDDVRSRCHYRNCPEHAYHQGYLGCSRRTTRPSRPEKATKAVETTLPREGYVTFRFSPVGTDNAT